MKHKIIIVLTIIALTAEFTGCNGASSQQGAEATTAPSITPSEAVTSAPSEPVQEPENTATLVADFSYGSAELSTESYELGYSGELTPEILIEGLSALTGLDFFASAVRTEYGFSVTWHADSTLIANLDDREQKDGFHFYDADSLRWFMMDSLYRTLVANFGEDDVFYSTEDGELAFDELYPTNSFPARIPYMGSAFYFAHADGRGFIYNEEEASDYLLEQFAGRGYSTEGTAIIFEPEAGDPWFGEMAVWYFAWGANTPEKFTAEKRFAVTYDWQVWELDPLTEDWTLWE
jgi:hypothetical protein